MNNPVLRVVLPLAFALLLVLVQSPLYAQDSKEWNQTQFTEEELREKYGTAEDEISMHEARLSMLERVTEDRLNYRELPGLDHDRLASRVAQEHAEEMAENRFLGHYDLSGRKAPQRFNEAGGTDMVIENVSYWEAEYEGYITPQILDDIQDRWLKSPGHFNAIMTPEATGLGFGIALQRHGEITVVTAVQLFVVDWGDFQTIPRHVGRGGSVNIAGRLHPSMTFFYAAVGIEPRPQQKSADYLNKHLEAYGTPEPFAGYLEQSEEGHMRLTGIETMYTISVGPDGHSLRGVVTLDDGKRSPGLYYVYIFATDLDGNVFPIMIQTSEVY